MANLVYTASATATAGAALLFYSWTQPSYVDTQGFLVEPFAWMASGTILLIAGAVLAIVAGVVWLNAQRQSAS